MAWIDRQRFSRPVGTGDNVLILGFVGGGTTPKHALIRGVGPGLAALNVSAPLASARLRLFSGQQAIAENAGWSAVATDAAALASAARTFQLERC